jgi:hypothetical protein
MGELGFARARTRAIHHRSDMVTDDERRQLAEFFREDDRLRAEHADYLTRREAERQAGDSQDLCFTEPGKPKGSPLVRKSQPNEPGSGLVYRTTETQPAAAAEPQPDYSGWEAWMAGHLANERAQLLDLIAVAMGTALAEERKTARTERDAELLKLRSEIAELRGKTDALLSMLQMKGGDIVDLPDWRKRHA